jgi:hypothetical protein
MSRHASSFLLLVFAILLSTCAVPAHADGIPVYLVAGSITITGNDVCGGVCTETIGFSFDVSFQPNPSQANEATPYVTNLTEIGSGNLGTFSGMFAGGANAVGNACFGNENFVPLGSAAGMEVDLYMCSNAGFQQGFTTASIPTILGSGGELYSCSNITCYNDFVAPCGSPKAGFGCNGGGPPPNFPDQGVYQNYPLEYSVSLLPEPPTFILLAAGMLGLGLLGATRKFLT